MDQTNDSPETISPLRRKDRPVVALVDDDRNILTTVSIGLQAEGFATRVYTDGETALKALRENPPDLAIFDIKMPRMDGLQLLENLRGVHWGSRGGREEGTRMPDHSTSARGAGTGRVRDLDVILL